MHVGAGGRLLIKKRRAPELLAALGERPFLLSYGS